MLREKTLRETVVRVAAMSRDELRTRLRQEIAKRQDAISFRIGLASISRELQASNGRARHQPSVALPLPPSPGRFFFEARDLNTILDVMRQRFPDEVEQTIEQANRICCHQFDLLGFERLDFGQPIDWHLDPVNGKRAPRKPWYKIRYLQFEEVGDHKVIWELNRHQHFVALAKAYHFTADERFLKELLHQWRHWHQENPYPVGINWASSLEAAFRSLAWIWVGHLLAPCPTAPKSFQYDLARGLALNARHIERYLSVYSSPNTHLLGEAVALFFIGTLFPQLRSAPRWQSLGWNLILEQAEKQVQADGMHFEQSIYYHVYALDFFLHTRILAARNDIAIPPDFDQTLQKMLELLAGLSQAGVAPRFGDDDGGRVYNPRRNRSEHLRDPLSTGAALYHREDLKAASGGFKEETLWLLGSEAAQQFDSLPNVTCSAASIGFPASGFYVLADCQPALRLAGAKAPPRARYGNAPSRAVTVQQMVLDAGSQGTGNSGHGHADALSVQLSIDGQEYLVDAGTYRYISAGSERDAFRGTAAHNTLQVDGLSQAEPIGPFAWQSLPRAQVERWVTTKDFDLLVANHDGYGRLPEPVMHRRWIFHLKPYFWLVRDVAEGVGEHLLEIFWHFAPYLVPSYTPPGFTMFPASGREGVAVEMRGVSIMAAAGHSWSQEVRRSRYSPAYGVEQPAPMVYFATCSALPAELAVIIQTVEGAATQSGRFAQLQETDFGVKGYHYESAVGEHFFVFSENGGSWELSPWRSDARFLYLGTEKIKSRLHVAICGGSFLEINGRPVMTSDRWIEYCELTLRGSVQEVACSDPEAVVECKSENLRWSY
ncbi:MAG TPA: alginate lyase family protein [Terriglobia bacterium]|nr:alginate lyase family protein [Terriglobia bacterium]